MNTTQSTNNAQSGFGLLLLACFLSGVAALAYELLWVRELALLAGSTQAAISCVLSVYFLGLALGNYIAGKIAHRLARPLRLYAVIELIIAAWAFIFYILLALLDGFYANLYQTLEQGSPWIHGLRIASAAALMLVPVICMGATIPLLAQFGARDLSDASRWSAWLYGVNTLGAMIGTFVTGFLLIEFVGVSVSLRSTAAINVLCVVCVLPFINQHRAGQSANDGNGAAANALDSANLDPVASRMPLFGKLLLVSFGVLGFCNIAAEVLWTRFYALVFTNDTYIFTSILIMYLLGVGVGSLIGDRIKSLTRQPIYGLGLLQITSAAWTIVMAYLVPFIVDRYQLVGQLSFFATIGIYIAMVGVGVLLPTLCMGASFPLLVRAVMRHPGQVGGVVGRALSWNTIGGVFGAALAGFVLLEYLGLQTGLYIAAGLTAVVGLAVCASAPNGLRLMIRPAVGMVLPALLLVVFYSPNLPEALIALHFKRGDATELKEIVPSVHGTTSVTEDARIGRRLWVNGGYIGIEKSAFSSGYVPWILHPNPINDALGMCMGTAGSFGALFNAAHCNLDLVEINAAVVEMSRKWFGDAHYHVLDPGNSNVVVDDARNFLHYTPKTYDLITVEPMQPFQKGTAYFYTREFYEDARAKLRVGGVICQYAPINLSLTVTEFQSMARTFVEVFPVALLWGQKDNTIFLGYKTDGKPVDFNEEEIYRRMSLPRLKEDLRLDQMYDKYDVFVHVLLDGEGLTKLGGDAPIYVDDRPSLEFTCPRRGGEVEECMAAIEPHLVDLKTLFDFPNERIASDVARLRELNMELMTTKQEPSGVRAEIARINQRLYREQ